MVVNKSLIKTDSLEILRYMGWRSAFKTSSHAEVILQRIEVVTKELLSIIQPVYTYKKLSALEKRGIQLFGEGKSIGTFLCNGDEAAFMAVTLGHGYECYARSKAYTKGALEQLVVEAVGTELIEKCADVVQEQLRLNQKAEKASRFSPGYGDFPIEYQTMLLDALEAHRIGIYCNAYNVMFPRKSITAVVKYEEFDGGCSGCGKDCVFRCTLK